MTALLIDNLPLLAGAPHGIRKLRELILELAVRGKLVPQDPTEEPASVLLKRAAEEKACLAKNSSIKTTPLRRVLENDAPFSLPKSWQWVHLGDLTELITSGSRDWAQHYSEEGAIFVRMGNLSRRSYELRLSSTQRVSPPVDGEGSRTKLKSGDLLLSITGEVGLLGLIPENFGEAYINQHVCLIRFVCSLRGRFLPEVLRSPLAYKQYEAPQRGVKNSFRLSDVSEIIVPLPPLAEQNRIVAKVDELMALCDRLEAQQADAESTHAQLVKALLDSLANARDAADFAANWQRLAEHFHVLFTTELSVDALKQTLLQLAAMGKLVPQDPNDEPASELLKRIAEEKSRLVAEGKLKKQKTLPEVYEDEQPYALPSSWKWARFDSASNTRLGKMLDKAKNKGELRPYLRNTNVQWFNFEMGDLKSMRFEEHELDEYRVIPGDLVICEGGEPGRCAVWQGGVEDMFIQKALHRARPWLGISPHFLKFCLKAATNTGHLNQFFTGATIKHLSGEKLAKYPIPIPPLAEQYRIVAKVEQLMGLCNRLISSLNQVSQLNGQVAGTLVDRALTDDPQQVLVATDRQVARITLAAEITCQLHCQRTFGQRKLQKVMYLAEHAAELSAIQGAYLRDAAGPHDRQLMNQVEGEMQNHQWYERIERETVGHAYRPLSQAGQHRQAYKCAWSVAERTTIEQVIELMRDWDTDRCEMTVTLYAAWNDFIIEGRLVCDEAIVDEVMHSWNDTKLRFSKTEWLTVLAEMKKHKILMPSGFGKRTTGGMLSLPGFK